MEPSLQPSPSPGFRETNSPSPSGPARFKPSVVSWNNMKFLIIDCPSDATLPIYLEEMQRQGVTDLVRVCEPTYNKQPVESVGISFYDWPFEDGAPPPPQVVNNWLSLVSKRFSTSKSPQPCIAVHCVAGLGRAPLLVVLALIEAGMAPLDAVAFVRQQRRGAINSRQLKFCEAYKPKSQKNKCVIS